MAGIHTQENHFNSIGYLLLLGRHSHQGAQKGAFLSSPGRQAGNVQCFTEEVRSE